GSEIAKATVAGGRVDVAFREPIRTSTSIDLTWSAPIPSGDDATIQLATFQPEGALSVASALQPAPDGDLEAVPQLGGGRSRAQADLPDFAQGLVAGTATAAFTTSAPSPGSLHLLRVEPVEEPAAVVDVAEYTAATTDEGRLLVRAHLEVRNERAAHLT